jgi:protein O-GlcNAc transferase
LSLCLSESKQGLLPARGGADAMRAVLQHYQAGNLAEAAGVCREIIADSPQNADALHLLGALLGQIGQAEEAIELVRRAIGIKPMPAYHDTLGRLLKNAGDIAGAIEAYRDALKLNPAFAEAHNNLGVALRAVGRLDEANEAFGNAIRIRPEFAEAYNNLGNGLIAAKNFEEAAEKCRRAVSLRPGYAEALNNLGIALREVGQFNESAAALREALQARPEYAEAHNNLGNSLRSLGRSADAISRYRRAVGINPKYAEAWNNLGVGLWELGQNAEAIAACERAIALKPRLAEAHSSLGNVLRDAGDLDRAEEHYRKALEINPNLGEAHANLAVVLKDQGRLDEAIASARQAIEIRPDAAAHSNLIYLMHFHPDYDSAAILREQKLWEHLHALTPSPSNLALGSEARARRGEGWGEGPARRLRIGYVSPNFRAHVVGLNIRPLLREHDHQRFEIFCYSDVPRGDEVTQKCWGFSDHWRNIAGFSDEKVAEMIRADGIDILVDLSLHLSSNRLRVFGGRAAKVQACFAGYPGGTGLGAMDYRITDAILDPLTPTRPSPRPSPGVPGEGARGEIPVRLASFWCYDESAMMMGCEDLEVGHLTFGCLNNFCKIHDRVLDSWVKVLHAVADSHLFVLAPGGSTRERFLGKLVKLGIESGRIEFADQRPRAQYLQHYHRIDIGLDTFPYNGHTTSLDSLWMGVPVVTLAGESPVGRAGVSQLTHLGLTQLIVRFAEEYVTISADLAGDLHQLQQIRSSLRAKMRASHLTDARAFARDVESAYRMMWAEFSTNE